MSRSNPNDQNNPNPSVRWYEWNGEKGLVRYYDKDAKINVECPEFTFLLLDQLGSVRGWHESSQSGIYSNEVRDTRQDAIVVKAFKGGTLAEGIYKDIKDRVNSLGGSFTANCYAAVKIDGELKIASIRFKGAALGAWMEFTKANRSQIYKQAIKIASFTEGKKGRVIFRVPVFALTPLSEATNQIALGLDAELQEWLSGYLKRTTTEKVAAVETAHHVSDEDVAQGMDEGYGPPDVTDDDIPF